MMGFVDFPKVDLGPHLPTSHLPTYIPVNIKAHSGYRPWRNALCVATTGQVQVGGGRADVGFAIKKEAKRE